MIFLSIPTSWSFFRGVRFWSVAQADGPSSRDFSAEKYPTPKVYGEKKIP